MKVLHVSFHTGCINEISFIADKLSLDLEILRANWNYNIGHKRAKDIWCSKKDYFEKFDVIITSDTAPLSRIFLQNGYKGKLIIWVCNRFDYSDNATNDCGFPDSEYYSLFKRAAEDKDVFVVGYTDFENIYASQKGISIKNLIKPTGCAPYNAGKSPIPDEIDRKNTFFIPPYHNDTIMTNLTQVCQSKGIKVYNGRYAGPNDLSRFKGVIHIPYAWSNLALFEMMQRGVPYYIPSERFISELSKRDNFFWSPPFQINHIKSSEWYHPDYKPIFQYFDNWDHLRDISDNSKEIDKELIKKIAKSHYLKNFNKWKEVLLND